MVAKTRSPRVSETPPWKWWTAFRSPLLLRTWLKVLRRPSVPRVGRTNSEWSPLCVAGWANPCPDLLRGRTTASRGAVPMVAILRRVSTAQSVSMSGVRAVVDIVGRMSWHAALKTVRCCLTARCRSSCTTMHRPLRRLSTRLFFCLRWVRTRAATTARTSPSTGSSCTRSSGTSGFSRCCAAGKRGRRLSTRRCCLRACDTPCRISCSLPSFAACGRVCSRNRLLAHNNRLNRKRSSDDQLIVCWRKRSQRTPPRPHWLCVPYSFVEKVRLRGSGRVRCIFISRLWCNTIVADNTYYNCWHKRHK